MNRLSFLLISVMSLLVYSCNSTKVAYDVTEQGRRTVAVRSVVDNSLTGNIANIELARTTVRESADTAYTLTIASSESVRLHVEPGDTLLMRTKSGEVVTLTCAKIVDDGTAYVDKGLTFGLSVFPLGLAIGSVVGGEQSYAWIYPISKNDLNILLSSPVTQIVVQHDGGYEPLKVDKEKNLWSSAIIEGYKKLKKVK